MPGAGVHATQLVLVLLLVLLVAFGAASRRLRMPYPIVLVLAGLAVSLVPGIPRPELEPDVVFLVFLPPLLYAGAWHTSWRVERETAIRLRDEHRISDDVLRQLERELDLTEARLEQARP